MLFVSLSYVFLVFFFFPPNFKFPLSKVQGFSLFHVYVIKMTLLMSRDVEMISV